MTQKHAQNHLNKSILTENWQNTSKRVLLWHKCMNSRLNYLNLEADFALIDAKCASRSSPHVRKSGEGHRCHFEAGFINRQTQVTVVYVQITKTMVPAHERKHVTDGCQVNTISVGCRFTS